MNAPLKPTEPKILTPHTMLVPKVMVPTIQHMTYAELQALDGQDGIKVSGIPAEANIYRDLAKNSIRYTYEAPGASMAQHVDLPADTALFREAKDGTLKGRAVLFAQNW